MLTKKTRWAVCGLAATMAAPAWADEETMLKTVTVTATGLPTEVFDNPGSITVIRAEDIAQSAPVSVAKLLRDVPGVQITEEGIERISIRGESSRRVAILIDGQKLTDHTNYGQPVLIDPASIERIEVVRGSSSVLSGSQAIGGVVNIITRKGADKPVQLTTSAGGMSATDGWRASAALSGSVRAGAGVFDYRLNAGRMRQQDRHTPDGRVLRSDTSDQALGLHSGYRLGNHYLGVKLQQFKLAANVPTGIPDFSVSLPQRDLKKASLFYEGQQFSDWWQSLSASLYRQTVDRLFSNDVTQRLPAGSLNVLSESSDAQTTWGLQLRAGLKLSPDSRTVLGLEWEDDQLQAHKNTQTTMFRPAAPAPIRSQRLRYDDASIRSTSLYAQHELALAPHWMLSLGGRWWNVHASQDAARENGVDLARSRNSDNRALFSAGLVWTGWRDVAVRANVSQGYVHPSLGQLFLSTTAGGAGTLIGNPQLRPERATTYELGLRYAQGGNALDGTLFLTDAKDYITSVALPGQHSGTSTVSQYQNIDSAKTWGLELQAEHQSRFWGLKPYATSTWLRREFRFANGFDTRDSGTPSVAARLGVRRRWSLGSGHGEWDLFARTETRVRMREQSGDVVSRAAGYATLHAHATARLSQGLDLVLELNNLTNRRYQPYSQMEGAQRSVNLFVNYQL